MMGERMVAQEALFYSFNLDRHVPADHLLRSIDRFVDLSAIREHLRPFYSETGRPSIDRAAQHDCGACMLKPKCCPNMPARKICAPSMKAPATWRANR